MSEASVLQVSSSALRARVDKGEVARRIMVVMMKLSFFGSRDAVD